MISMEFHQEMCNFSYQVSDYGFVTGKQFFLPVLSAKVIK